MRRLFGKYGRSVERLTNSNRRFQFGNTTFDSLGSVTLPLGTPSGIATLDVKIDVVAAGVPALVGLDFLNEHALIVGTVTNRLITRTIVTDHVIGGQYVVDEWNIPLARRLSHV